MPQRPNTIARCIATFAALPPIEYADWGPDHIRGAHFRAIMANHPETFTAYTTDGAAFSVDLRTGALTAAGEVYEPQLAEKTPLRLIYYRRMEASLGDSTPTCVYFVVGWQTTTLAGRNLRAGLRISPAAHTWELTEDI